MLPIMKRGDLRGRISTKPGLNRYLRVTPGGLLRIDMAKMKTEANLDGKYLLRCSDPHLPAADIALGLQAAPRPAPGLSLLEERIRAHVVLCWLALLLIRIIETSAGDTWTNVSRHLDRLHPGPSPARPGCPATYRAVQAPTRPARHARHPSPEADHRTRPHKPLTSGNTTT
jgi:hypothetical protein